MLRFNGIMTNPLLPITEEQLAEGFVIIDEALTRHADPAEPAEAVTERVGLIGLGLMGKAFYTVLRS